VRLQEQTVKRTLFNSGSIISAGYDYAKQSLEIEFTSLNVYRYSNVPKRIWLEFKAVLDKANYWQQFIGGQYEVTCTTRRQQVFPALKAQKDKT